MSFILDLIIHKRFKNTRLGYNSILDKKKKAEKKVCVKKKKSVLKKHISMPR